MSDDERGGANWVQVTAAALAAMSSAVLLSTLGVAGTIVGAAVGSLSASLGGALYSRGLHASRQQVAAQAAALRRVTQARVDVDAAVDAMRRGESGSDTTLRRADAALGEAEEALHDADVEGEDGREGEAGETEPGDERAVYGVTAAENPEGTGDEPRKLPWKRIALISVGVFVAAMVAITAFELIAGRAVSTYTGGTDSDKGTTVPGLGSTQDSGPQDQPGEEQPTGEPTEQPGEEPTTEPPTEPADPTTAPSEVPSGTPTPTPTLTPAETAAPEDGSAS